MDKIVHILRYGTVAEKAHLEKAFSAYDYLSINGNTAAYVSNAISKFIVEKFFNSPEKGFFIDPITYAFQREIGLLKSKSKTGGISIKKSIKKLIDEYGEPVNKILSDSEITVNDFDNNDMALGFCKRVLEFQYSVVSKHIKENDLEKYLMYAANLTDLGLINQLKPKFLIAPYFYLDNSDSTFEKWLDVNLRFIEMSIELSKKYFRDIPIFAQIAVSNDVLLDNRAIEKIADVYNKCHCVGLTIWVDDLNEHETSREKLNGFINLLTRLKGKSVYNMYGGYFSILLTNKKVDLLSGVSHGLEYGESRKVYPIGGGIPVSKYYYLPLHQRMDFTKAFYLLENEGILNTTKPDWGNCDRYYSEICRCAQCKQIMDNTMINFVKFESDQYYEIKQKNHTLRRKKASSDTKENCLYHYLLCKKVEFSKVKKFDIEVLLNDLEIEKHKYINCVTIREDELAYVDNWINALCKFRVGNKDD